MPEATSSLVKNEVHECADDDTEGHRAHGPGNAQFRTEDARGHDNGQNIDGRSEYRNAQAGPNPAPMRQIPAKSGRTVQEQTARMVPETEAGRSQDLVGLGPQVLAMTEPWLTKPKWLRR